MVDMLDNVICISDEFQIAEHKCICGCGTLISTPLNKNDWKYNINKHTDSISMQPSIGNFQIPCNTHYIFSKGNANFV